jgi:hypothetical protein
MDGAQDPRLSDATKEKNRKTPRERAISEDEIKALGKELEPRSSVSCSKD